MADNRSKIEKIKDVNNNIEWLRDEYNSITLWGSCPDGDVKFEAFIEWLGKNSDNIEYMIKLAKDMDEL